MKKSSVDQSLNSTNNIEFIAILKESFGYIKDDVGRGDNTFYSQDGHENAQMTGFRGLLKQINVDLYDYFCVKMDHKPHEIPRILIINAEFHKESKNSYLRGGQHTDSAEDDNYDDSILTDWCHELFSALILGTNSLSNTSVNDIGSKLKFKDGFRKNGIVLFIGRLPQLTLRDIALPAPNMPSDQEFDSAIEAMRRSILYLRMCESAGISEYAQFNINKFDIPENRSNLRSIIFDLINNKKGVDFKDKTPLIITQIKKIFTLTEEGGHSSRKSIDNQDLTVLKPSEWCVNIANFIDFDVDIDDYGRIKLLKTTQSNNNGNKIDLFANLYLFLRQLSAMQMLGIAEQPDVIKEINRVVPWMNGSGGLYVPRRRIAIIASGDKPDIDNHQPAQDLRLIRRIEVFRDLSRCLIRNNFIWSVDRKSNSLNSDRRNDLYNEVKIAKKPIKVLIIDDLLCFNTKYDEIFKSGFLYLYQILKINGLFSEGTFEYYHLDIDNIKELTQFIEKNDYINADGNLKKINFDRFRKELLKYPDMPWEDIFKVSEFEELITNTKSRSEIFQVVANDNFTTLLDFDYIFVDIAFDTLSTGPEIIRRLIQNVNQSYDKRNSYLSIKPGDFENEIIQKKHKLPRIAVITREHKVDYINQCFAYGADLYLDKNRIFQLPARIIELEQSDKMPHNYQSVSNYKVIDTFLPPYRSFLESGQVRNRIVDDLRSKKWISELPKSDLHCHMATSMDGPTVAALALNTLGYFSRNIIDFPNPFNFEIKTKSEVMQIQLYKQIIEIMDFCMEVFVNSIRNISKNNAFDDVFKKRKILRTIILEKAIKKGWVGNNCQAFEMWDKIVGYFVKLGSPVYPHEIMGAFFSSFNYLFKRYSVALNNNWQNVNEFNDWKLVYDMLNSVDLPDILKDRARISYRNATSTMPLSFYTDHAEIFFKIGDDPKYTLEKRIDMRIKYAINILERAYCEVYSNLNEADKFVIKEPSSYKYNKGESLLDVFSVDDLYKLSSESGTLPEYLEGAGILGAEHLQYPENLLLAAYNLVKLNADDRVIYNEIRCETTGYTKGGMTAPNATRFLCVAFDIASIFNKFSKKSKTFCRTNILLGAKRHKKSEDIEKIINLLVNILESNDTDLYNTLDLNKDIAHRKSKSNPEYIPIWWSPCRVVGFDLSGNESGDTHSEEVLADLIRPLFREASPITIHAGEAASAESIWAAVFRFGARRIGHGLRLRERSKLLDYCVTRKICMELCPISNSFTNGFSEIANRDDREMIINEHSRYINRRYTFPLLAYMLKGMDICINTDNKLLHERSTLTDEYLQSARLSGYLTKSEVLKITRAGFRNAFMPEDEIDKILTYVENYLRLYLTGGPYHNFQG